MLFVMLYGLGFLNVCGSQDANWVLSRREKQMKQIQRRQRQEVRIGSFKDLGFSISWADFLVVGAFPFFERTVHLDTLPTNDREGFCRPIQCGFYFSLRQLHRLVVSSIGNVSGGREWGWGAEGKTQCVQEFMVHF